MLFETLIHDVAALSAVMHAHAEERLRPVRRLGDAEGELGYMNGWQYSGAFSFIQAEKTHALADPPEKTQGRIINFMV